MKIKEILAKHGVENAEMQVELENLLKTAESKNTDGVPYTRFKEKVTETNGLRADLAEKEAELERLREKSTLLESQISELSPYKEKYADFEKQQRQSKIDRINQFIEAHKVGEEVAGYDKWVKAEKMLIIKDEYTDSEIDKNLITIDTLTNTDYFGRKDTPPDGKKPKGAPPATEDNPFITGNRTEQILLWKNDPALYEKLKKEAGK